MIANSIKAQIDEAKHVMKRQMARIAELEAEVERLKANASAHQTLASIYSDPHQPTGHRIKAAGLALGVETPRLESVPPAIDATAEEIIPLADLVRRRRARQNALQGLPPGHPKFLEWANRDHEDYCPDDGKGNGDNTES